MAKFQPSSWLRVLTMSVKRLCVLLLMLIIGCHKAGIGAEESALMVNHSIEQAELTTKLRIYKNALFEGSKEQIRVDAAGEILVSSDPLAREMLLGALKQRENRGARMAVCKALSESATSDHIIKNKQDFIIPLLDILKTEAADQAEIAARACLIFDYEQLSKQMEEMATDRKMPTAARINAIGALKLQPDKRAILKLIDLLDDSEEQVSVGAEKALTSLNIPVGTDAASRRQIRNGIEQMGRREFLRDWGIRQETRRQLLEIEKQRDHWRQLYLEALDRVYAGIKDDGARGKFLGGYLADSEAVVRLWALGKTAEWWSGTNKSKLPIDVLGPALMSLISDQDRDVRLETADLLCLMGNLNTAERLLEQMRVEGDDNVRMRMFVALGVACHYALSSGGSVTVSPEITTEVLEWAKKYLFEPDPVKSQKGAEVMKKLLERNGMTAEKIGQYLEALAGRYEQEQNKPDGMLRGELLRVMAGLCAQSAYQTTSARLFKPLFEGALKDETDSVREAAVNGLVNIDKARALKKLRTDFIDDPNPRVREKLAEVAGEVGGKDDLGWLWGKIGPNGENEPAWQAMLKIFRRSEAAILAEWVSEFELPETKTKLSDDQRLSFLEIAERKATGENEEDMLRTVRKGLARLYRGGGKFERAEESLVWLLSVALADGERESVLADLLDVYLRWPRSNAAVELLNKRLLEKDLSSNDAIIGSIDNYLRNPPGGADPNTLVCELLSRVIAPRDRSQWQVQVQRWTESMGGAREAAKLEKGGS